MENKNNKVARIKALNLTEGEILTLDKAKDRLEFEALITTAFDMENKDWCVGKIGDCSTTRNCIDVCVPKACSCDGSHCTDCHDCFADFACDCVGPMGYCKQISIAQACPSYKK